MNFEILAKPNPNARDPLFYLCDYAELTAIYEQFWKRPSPHRRQWYFGMNVGKFSWSGNIRLKVARKWRPAFGFWRVRYPSGGWWTVQFLSQFLDIEASWG